MLKRFLVSVANVTAMQGSDIIFTSKTLINSSISVETDSTNINGGKGNPLQAVYFHTPQLNLSLEDTQFRLEYLALNVGSAITQTGDVWSNETVTLTGTTGTLTGTPVPVAGQTDVFVYTEYEDANLKLPVTGNTFSTAGTSIPANATICVSYLNTNLSARTMVIPANFMPSRVRLFLDADLYGDTDSSAVVGHITIEVFTAQLTGAQEITLEASGYSTTPLNAMALVYNDTSIGACGSTGKYARITELILDTDAWAGVTGLSLEQGDFSMNVGESTLLRVWAVKNDGTAFMVDNSKLTFEAATTAVATVGAHTGVVDAISAGSSDIKIFITEKASIETHNVVTVNA